jgi:transcriptional regulator with XRE-family HTH domain
MQRTTDIRQQTTGLGQLLEDRGIRPSWVARKIGIDPAAVTRWSKGQNPIPQHRLEAMAALLDVEPESLR